MPLVALTFSSEIVKLQTALQNCRDWSGHDTMGPIMSYLIDLVPCLIGWSSLEKQHIMIIVGLSWIFFNWCIDANTTLDWISSQLASTCHQFSKRSPHIQLSQGSRKTPLVSGRREAGNRTWDPKRLKPWWVNKHISKKGPQKMDPKSQDANVIQSQCQLCRLGRLFFDFHPCHQHIIGPASQQSVGVSQCDLHLPNLRHAGMRFSDGHRIEKFLRIGIFFSWRPGFNRGIPKWKRKPMELKLQKTCLDPGHSWARESSFARQN